MISVIIPSNIGLCFHISFSFLLKTYYTFIITIAQSEKRIKGKRTLDHKNRDQQKNNSSHSCKGNTVKNIIQVPDEFYFPDNGISCRINLCQGLLSRNPSLNLKVNTGLLNILVKLFQDHYPYRAI